MDRIGYIMHDAITPAIGNNPFADAEDISCKLTTCCEGEFMVSFMEYKLMNLIFKTEYFYW